MFLSVIILQKLLSSVRLGLLRDMAVELLRKKTTILVGLQSILYIHSLSIYIYLPIRD